MNARAAGPRLGKQVQVAIKASKSGDWTVTEDGTVLVGVAALDGGLALEEGEYELATVVAADAEGAEPVSYTHLSAGHSEETARDNLEEGGDDVKSSCPL